MKRTKRIFAIFMTIALAMSMLIVSSAVSFAAPDTAHTIKITSDATQKEDHAYEAYQVFVGTYDTTSKQLKNFAWGNGVDSTALLNDLTKIDAYKDCTTAAQVAAVLGSNNDDSAEAKAFAELVSKHLNATNKVTATGDKTNGYELPVTGDGYYFIKDTTASLNAGDTYSSFMLQVVGDVNVKAKDSTTESSKKVKDADDTAGTTTDWQDSADYDIGDKVPFKLTGKVAADYDKYTKYTFIFHDVESNGLTFNNDAKVYVDGEEITTGFEVKTGLEDGCTFEVVFSDLKKVTSAKAGSVITVEYTSTLNENAVIGQKGNPNTSHIEFSNNPNGEQTGTGRTPDDTVIVFTYKTTATKVDENKNALNGADFTLYKEVPAGTTNAKTGEAIKANFDKKVKADALDNAKSYVEAGKKTGSTAGNTFEFKGIDDGTYVLVETTIPAGYNAWAAQKFVVEATHNGNTAIDPETGKVAGKNEYVLTALTGESLFGETGDGTITLEAEKADLDVTIINESGAELPETGGIGTIIFYVLGSLLVVGCGIVLISKRRMESR